MERRLDLGDRFSVTSNNTWSSSANDQGTIAVTSVSNGRMVGTFSATLAPTNPSSNTTPLVLSNGTFDVPFP